MTFLSSLLFNCSLCNLSKNKIKVSFCRVNINKIANNIIKKETAFADTKGREMYFYECIFRQKVIRENKQKS